MPDILTNDAPALSATSDAPMIETPEVPAEPVVETTETAQEADTGAETLEAAEGEEEADLASGEAEAAPQPAPKQNSYQRRISELTSARRAAEERADRAIAALEAFAKTTQPTETKPDAPQPVQIEPKPSRDDFADPDTYDTALIEWSARETARVTTAAMEQKAADQRAAEEKQRANDAMMAEQQALAAQWQERRAKALEKHPDFAEVAERQDLEIPVTMVPALLHSENGPDVLYHFGMHPEEAARIAKLAPLAQAIEIGRISATLAQANKPQVTKAPKPITPVGARDNAGPKDPNEMTTEEYAAYRLPKLNADRKASMYGQRH